MSSSGYDVIVYFTRISPYILIFSCNLKEEKWVLSSL